MVRLSRRHFLQAAGAVAAAPAVDLAAQTAAPSSSIAVDKNVLFGKGGAIDLRLDIYKPAQGTEKRGDFE
jgi:hypothetical protein